ncbi:adhesion G protein-coupled receptor A2 isoform X2 [Hemiscyllium ocellatum]|uniref:adhesion G protein-coupled receptor A2 isoform X2 n=1 Tax=Hemiscyllium ocellatum TaxID=170820 RepID=UPI002966FB7B|nr:adhesion G protein-coupled receptor A2 isoform X2 [Hemiscyllium ocellatum]
MKLCPRLVFFLCLLSQADCCSQLLTNTCICIEERPKGASYPEVRRKVVCSKQELQDVPQSSLLPNRTAHLILSNNKIVILKAGAFSGLQALEKLDLKNNLISTIQPGAFQGLSALRRLDLSNNRIGCLKPAMFQNLTNLTRLNLSGNIFSTLHPELFAALVSLKVVDFNTEFLICDCNMRWVLNWQQRRLVRVSKDTLCAYPRALRRQPFRDLKESQLVCDGPLELPILQLIPSLRQVVFQGDRLPLLCTATYLDNSTRVLWYHNNMLVQPQEEGAVITVESLIHDCCLISSELILSNIYLLASGEWECVITTSRGKVSRKVDIVVIDTSATYCQAEQVTNNRGEFRWPRTLAGITVYQPCLQYPYPSSSVNGVSLEKRTSRKCQRSGQWEDADYSECLYTNDYTRVLYTFILMPINSSNALTLAHQLLAYTVEAANFCDMMDVIYVAQMIEKFISFTAEIHDLSDLVVEMASNMMLVDDHVLWMAQQDSAACSRIVRSVEHIAVLTLASDSQAITKVSTNIAVEAFLVKPAGYMGLSCTAFQREHPFPNREGQVHGTRPQLSFRCNTGNLTGSLGNFPVKNSIALASVQLPLSLFSQSAPGPGGNSSSCRLQFVVFRNGKLFPSTGNSSNLADQSRQRSPSTPVIFTGTDGCGVSEARDPILVSLRHWQTGEDQVAAHWDFELLNGHGGWQIAGCHITHTKANITSMWCHTFSNMAVLKIKTQPVPTPGAIQALHPIIYSCTVVLLICLFIAIITYILKHNTIRVSRKNWHMFLNLWFHISMTCAVFTGGINRTEYGLICQVIGIVLHYSSLSTLLWIGVAMRVIYKEVTHKPPRQQELEVPSPSQRPMLRFYLIAGGIPLIICGITAAVNLHNYSDYSPYCWLAWKPSLGAFYVPVGFTVLVSWIYFLCAALHLRCYPQGKAKGQRAPEGEQQLAANGIQLTDSGSGSGSGLGSGLSDGPSLANENEDTLEGHLWALITTQLLFIGLWTFGALSVSQAQSLQVVFSCLYGVTAVSLGLLVLIHHCLKQQNVCRPWLPCTGPGPTVNGSLSAPPVGLGPQLCLPAWKPDSPHSNKSSSLGSNFSGAGQGKLSNLQAALNQADSPNPSGLTPCDVEELPQPSSQWARAKAPRHCKHHQVRRPKGAVSDPGSSENGSQLESCASSRTSQWSHLGTGRGAAEPDASVSPSEGSDTGSQPQCHSTAIQCSVSGENLKQPATLDNQVKRRSYPLNTVSQNGTFKGSKYDVTLFGGEGNPTINTSMWKSETTV